MRTTTLDTVRALLPGQRLRVVAGLTGGERTRCARRRRAPDGSTAAGGQAVPRRGGGLARESAALVSVPGEVRRPS